MKKLVLILFLLLLAGIIISGVKYVEKTDLSPAKSDTLISGPINEWSNENLGIGGMSNKDLRRAQNMEGDIRNQIKGETE